jgi:acetyl esterase/lipase
MKSFLCLLGFAAFLSCLPASASEPQVIALWNGAAPGSENWTYAEVSGFSPVDNTLSIRNVVRPTLTVYLPAPGTSTGTAMIVIPGGSFESVAYDKEGEGVAHWLNSRGIAAFVLKYRVARTGDADAKDPGKQNARVQAVVPLAIQDAKQALRIVRDRAADWGIKANRIGVIGFSAGGYMAICLGSDYDARTRPDFVAAIYAGSPPGLNTPEGAPPLFLALAADDPYVPKDSFGAFTAWRKAHASVELHAYAIGGHGFALRKGALPVNSWNERFRDWLAWLGYLTPAKPPG